MAQRESKENEKTISIFNEKQKPTKFISVRSE